MRYILLFLLAFVTTFASAQVQFLGSPTTTVRNRGNFVSDSLFYLPKRQVAPSDTAALRYAISDSSVYVWTGNEWRRIGRAGASFLSVSDTSSMLSPYIREAGNGLTKSGQSLLVDTAAIATRARVQKAVDSINSNVALKVNISDTASMLTPYTRGSGTTNYLPKFTGTRTFGNSVAFDNGSELLIGTTTDAGAYALQVAGSIYNTTGAVLAASSGDVGIGVTPQSKLHVAGKITIDNTHSVGFKNATGGTDAAKIMLFSDNVMYYDNPDGDMSFRLSASYNERLRLTTAGELWLGFSSDQGSYQLQVNGAIYNNSTITTGAPSGGTAKPFKIGEAATVSPTSPNRTIRVEIDGTVYYIHAKTTND